LGITGLIGVIALLIFAVIFVVPVLGNIEDISNNGLLCGALGICLNTVATEDTQKNKDEVVKQEVEAENVKPDETGETLCDLSVKVNADLVDEFGFIKIKIDPADSKVYQWHCQFDTLSWLGSVDFTPLAFFFESEFIHAEIKLIQKDDTSKWYDANHPDYKSMYREIRLTDTSGFVDLPLNFDQSFYVEDVVHADYTLEIYYGRVINDLNAGEPLKTDLCEAGKQTC
jgi:hypothetical protein